MHRSLRAFAGSARLRPHAALPRGGGGGSADGGQQQQQLQPAAQHRSPRHGLPALAAFSAAAAAAAFVAPAAASAAAASVEATKLLRFNAAVALLPHPEKQKTGGEDAAFCAARSLAVADGVGGWALNGVDAGIFARQLIEHLKQLCTAATARPGSVLPADAPRVALAVAASRMRVLGSSTALVALLSGGSTLRVANLGDSGLMVLRGDAVVLRTKAQTTGFNRPLQIAAPGVPGSAAGLADLYSAELRCGDVLVAATDGVWDNLFDSQVAGLVRASLARGDGPAGAARAVVSAAHTVGRSPTASTPFERDARAAGYTAGVAGGKLDDTCCVVAVVEADGEPPAGAGGGQDGAAPLGGDAGAQHQQPRARL